jgi:hypothetical protein
LIPARVLLVAWPRSLAAPLFFFMALPPLPLAARRQ